MKTMNFLPRICLLGAFLCWMGCPDEPTAGNPLPPDAPQPIATLPDAGASVPAETDAGSVSSWSFDITQPLNASGHFAASPISFSGTIVPPSGHNDPIENVQVRWEEDGNNLHTGHDNESGRSSFNTSLAPGHHTIHAHVVDFDNTDNILATASVNIYVCANGDLLDFSAAIDDAVWHTHIGDQNNTSSEREIWHEDGYLELSNSVSNHTALVEKTRQFSPGNLHLAFRMSMGRCAEPETTCFGTQDVADGFAISIFSMDSAEDTIALINNHTRPGGGLGYMLMDSLQDGTPPPSIEAFHLQFDAYYNHTDIGHHHDDPTENAHVQVHFNGNHDSDLDPSPDNEISLWAEIPELVDNQWHDMSVRISGNTLIVTRDGDTLIEGTIPAYDFKGGYLVLTATTGAVGMYQRLDDLDIMTTCPYQAADED
tara:strand:+ start:2022 stop:3302 length:1281 start_codon:yes stop_codon:yes gene_type:complete